MLDYYGAGLFNASDHEIQKAHEQTFPFNNDLIKASIGYVNLQAIMNPK